MKTIFTFLLILVSSYTSLAIKGVYKGDTIRYRFDKILVEVSSTDIVEKGYSSDYLQQRIKYIKNALNAISIVPPTDDERVTIEFLEMGEDMSVWNYKEIVFTRSKRNAKSLIVFDDGTTFEKDYGKYCIAFSTKEVKTRIFMNNLEDFNLLLEEAYEVKVASAQKFLENEFGEKYKKNIGAWLDLRGEQVKGYYQDGANKTLDMLILSGGIGSGWVKNTFVSDINFRLGISFSKKGMFKNSYNIDWNMMYDFSESNDNKFYELNHFVSLAWEHNFSNTPENDKWYGFSVGYLVKRNNSFFKENTFRLAVNKKINDTFVVKPELYFNDFFQNVYPGIRLSVAF